MNTCHWKILYLSQDPALIRTQLAGETLTREQAGPLRDDVSTDEITPVHIMSHYDDSLGDFAHTGLRCGHDNPIERRALRQAGFAVLVAGRRYGKGSSREHSPTAEKLAGVQLVIAESFERIYRQNADNIGLFTSTDFGLLDRMERGEALTLADLVQGREALAASVLEAGGLLRWGQRFLSSVDSPTGVGSYSEDNTRAPTGTASHKENGPQTLFEKILMRHRLTAPHTPEQPQPGDGLFVQADWRFIHEYYTGMADTLMRGALGEHFTLQRPEQVVVFEDHTSYVDESPAHVRGGLIANMHAMRQAQRNFAARHGLRMHRTLTEAEVLLDDGRNVAGISHAMVAEHYALPGQVVVGTDSHTPHSGALGCVAFGVGTTDMANAFVTGAVRVTLPECVRVELQGQLPVGVTAKDLMLHLLATPYIRSGNGVGKVFEFTGTGIAHLSTDERATLTNMCAELGGLTGIVAPDAAPDFLVDPAITAATASECSPVMTISASSSSLSSPCPLGLLTPSSIFSSIAAAPPPSPAPSAPSALLGLRPRFGAPAAPFPPPPLSIARAIRAANISAVSCASPMAPASGIRPSAADFSISEAAVPSSPGKGRRIDGGNTKLQKAREKIR